MFPWFGTLKASGNVASLNADAKYQQFLDRQNELYLQVKKAYYPLVELETTTRIQQQNLEILNTYKRLATTSFSSGKSAMVDVLRVDIMIDEITTDIQLLKDMKKPLETAFNRLLNRDDSLAVIINDSLTLENEIFVSSRDSLFTQNPTLNAINLQLQAAEANESLADKRGKPQFGVGVDYIIVAERPDLNIPQNGQDAIMPMVTMSLPLFRGKYNALKKQTQLTQTALAFQKIEIENQLISQFEMARYEVIKAQK